MGTTASFVKLRSSGDPKVGEWNINYKKALALAKKEHKFIVTLWTNGDACSHCVHAEKCMMTSEFKTWMKKQDAYFVFQHSGDKDKGQTLHKWIFTDGGVRLYPGFRITLYKEDGSIEYDKAAAGTSLRDSKTGVEGAKNMIAKLNKILAKRKSDEEKDDTPVAEPYKVRLNEALTTAQVNKILDAIDKADGYCPCQIKAEGTKCHCEDFVKNKGFGEPCICKIYVKQPVK